MATTILASQADVLRLPAPDDGEALYYDQGKDKDRVTGLALRLRAGGSRRWMFFYRFSGKQQRINIGDATATDLEAARKKARQFRVALDNGENPKFEKISKLVAAKLTLQKVIDDYLDVRAADMKPRALEGSRRHLKGQWKSLHGYPLASITREIVATRLREIARRTYDESGQVKGGPVAANRARGTLSALFTWAIGEGLCETNPVAGTNKNSETSRDRVLTDAELARIWLAAPNSGYGRIVKLLMLTAQRRDEIGSLSWSEIKDLDKPEKALIALPKERTKNGRAHDVPLSKLAVSVLEDQPEIAGRELVFGEGEGGYSGWSRSKAALDTACKVKGWTLHDLRRTAATRMADMGVQPHIIEAALNHVSGHKGGVAGIYNRSTYAAEKRAALNEWAAYLQVEIAKASGANVTNIKQRKAKQ
jgi:integrase